MRTPTRLAVTASLLASMTFPLAGCAASPEDQLIGKWSNEGTKDLVGDDPLNYFFPQFDTEKVTVKVFDFDDDGNVQVSAGDTTKLSAPTTYHWQGDDTTLGITDPADDPLTSSWDGTSGFNGTYSIDGNTLTIDLETGDNDTDIVLYKAK